MSQNSTSDELSGRIDYSQGATYFKYCSNDEKVIKGIFEDHTIRFTQPAALNDPLEFNPILRFKQARGKCTVYLFDGVRFPSEVERLRSALIESQLNIYGVLSLTKDPYSFDMWSRYANGHTGLVLEFKADFNEHRCMLSKDGVRYDVYRVEYVDEYAIDVDDLVGADGLIPLATFNGKLFYTKASRWNDEMEYRMVRRLADHPAWHPVDDKPHRDLDVYCFDLHLECLRSIVFGACMKSETKKRIMEACDGRGIRFAQAHVVKDEKDRRGQPGSVRAYWVEDWRDACPWGDLAMVAEHGNMDENGRPPVEIGSLDELPYYEIDKKRVDLYYAREKGWCNRQNGAA